MPNYPWERFWIKQGTLINTDYEGFPDYSVFTWKYNIQTAFTLSELDDVPCLILLGEPGIGKSTVLKNVLVNYSNSKVLTVTLNKHTSSKDILNEINNEVAFQKWRDSQDLLYLYLDGLDEGILHTRTIGIALIDWLKNIPIERLRFRLTCRTAVWESAMEEELHVIFKKATDENSTSVQLYELAPLRQKDIKQAVEQESLDYYSFKTIVLQKDLIGMAIKPVTLNFLLKQFKEGKQISDLNPYDIYLNGCRHLCAENNKNRQISRSTGYVSTENRLQIASRIAFYSVFCNKPFIVSNFFTINEDDNAISPRDIISDVFNINDRDTQILNAENYREVLDTGLFSAGGKGFLSWAHRTYAEFLAAWHISFLNLDINHISQLFLSPADRENKVIPQLEETAAWLATKNEFFFDLLLTTQPEILLRTDGPILDAKSREQLVNKIIESSQRNELKHSYSAEKYYHRLNHPGLAGQLAYIITNKEYNYSTRRIAIEIAEACTCNEVADTAVILALDRDEFIGLRKQAILLLEHLNVEDSVLERLRPLALEQDTKDEDDEIKGVTLKVLWPKLLKTQEVLSVMTEPKSSNLIGYYKMFIDTFSNKVPEADLPLALNYIANSKHIYQGDDERDNFGKLLQSVISKTWSHLDESDVLDLFAQVIIKMHIHHKSFFIPENAELRRRVCSKVLEKTNKEEHFYVIASLAYRENHSLIYKTDWDWLIQEFNQSENQIIKQSLTLLAKRIFDVEDIDHINTIIHLSKQYTQIYQEFKYWLEPIDMDSESGQLHIKAYLLDQESKIKREENQLEQKIEPLPDEYVHQCLEKFMQTQDLNAWCYMHYYLSYTKPGNSSTSFPDVISQLDIRQYPIWQNLGLTYQQSIIDNSTIFLETVKKPPIDWILTDKYNALSLAGYKDLGLLYVYNQEWVDNLNTNFWENWAPIIVHISLHARELPESSRQITKICYAKATATFLHYLQLVINKVLEENNEDVEIHNFKYIFDETINEMLFKALNSEIGKQENKVRILRFLFDQGSPQAARIVWKNAESFSSTDDSNTKTLSISCGALLLEYCAKYNWKEIWLLLQANNEYCSEVFLYAVEKFRRRDLTETLTNNVSESDIGDVLLWLFKAFPPERDIKHKGAYSPSPRDSIAEVRDQLLRYLVQKGSIDSVLTLENIVATLTQYDWIKWHLSDAKSNMRRNLWHPPSINDLRQLLKAPNHRLVRSGNELLTIVIESLGRLQEKLQGENPISYFLWDKCDIEGNKNYKPKDENALSDFLKMHLEYDLKEKGILVHREVEIKHSTGYKDGERTDLYVTATSKDRYEQYFNTFTVIIEVKGNWHPELYDAMETQLKNKYLSHNDCRHGLYLVGWFNCLQWNSTIHKTSFNELETNLSQQANRLSRSNIMLKSKVLDCRL